MCIVNCITAALRVMINLSNDNEEGCRQLGENGGLEVVFRILGTFCRLEEKLDSFHLGVMKYEEQEEGDKQRIAKRNVCFDVQLLGLGLIINLVEKDSVNRDRVRDMGTGSLSLSLSALSLYITTQLHSSSSGSLNS